MCFLVLAGVTPFSDFCGMRANDMHNLEKEVSGQDLLTKSWSPCESVSFNSAASKLPGNLVFT